MDDRARWYVSTHTHSRVHAATLPPHPLEAEAKHETFKRQFRTDHTTLKENDAVDSVLKGHSASAQTPAKTTGGVF